MGRFRIPPEVATKLQDRFRRSHQVQIAVTVVLAIGTVAALWLARDEKIDLDRCRQLYAEARNSADTLRVDSLKLDFGEHRSPERGGKDPVRCRVARD
jgi:hypothetical protein